MSAELAEHFPNDRGIPEALGAAIHPGQTRMTEQEWLNCEDPLDLAPAYWRRETSRQFWLY
jgi:hypothetical protein